MLLQTWSLSRSESVPFQMVWHDDEGYIPPSNGSSITCSQNHYIEIINIYGRTTGFNIDVKVTRTERFQIKQTCNCKTTCLVPAFLMQEKKEVGLFGLAVGLWKLHVEYRCIRKRLKCKCEF